MQVTIRHVEVLHYFLSLIQSFQVVCKDWDFIFFFNYSVFFFFVITAVKIFIFQLLLIHWQRVFAYLSIVCMYNFLEVRSSYSNREGLNQRVGEGNRAVRVVCRVHTQNVSSGESGSLCCGLTWQALSTTQLFLPSLSCGMEERTGKKRLCVDLWLEIKAV